MPSFVRKAQPTSSAVHSDSPLTNISVAYIQDNDNFIADKVFPIVPVQHQSDLYWVWDKDDFYRDEAQKRADGQESAGTGMNLDTASYKADVWGLHQDLGDQMRANADPGVDPEVTAARKLTGQQMIRRDRQFASDYMVAGKWATDMTGVAHGSENSTHVCQWSDQTYSDPFTDISNGQTSILENTGFLPNVLTLGWQVYQALRKHPMVLERIKYSLPATANRITMDLLAAAFDVDRVVVAKSAYNTSKEGDSTPTYAFAIGKVAMLTYSNPAPSLMEPSAGYIFGWNGYAGANAYGISTWTEPVPNRGRPGSTIRVESESTYDMGIVGSDLGYFFPSIVA